MHITNYKQLAKTPLRKKALQIVEAGYAAIEIQTAIKTRVAVAKNVLTVRTGDKKEDAVRIDLNEYKRIFLVGIGKGSALASVEMAKVLKDHLTKGIAIDVEKPKLATHNLKLATYVGTHPLPSAKNVRATQKIMRMVSGLDADDLVIVFMCGGGSALAVASDEELRASTTVFRELTNAGANIIELNTVRKHVSDIKGGNLAKAIHPATILTLMVSDVIGNDLEMIASGPTILDTTTKADAQAIMKKYGVSTKGIAVKETPKDERYFKHAKNMLFVSNDDAIRAMFATAKNLGLQPRIKTRTLTGEAKKALVPIVRGIKKGEAILLGGETTVTLKGSPAGKKLGKGGRNQEAVLGVLAAYAANPEKLGDIVAVSYASDEHDNSEAAGALADGYALKVAMREGQQVDEALTLHASFDFFKRIGNQIRVKNRSFNVSDLMLVIREK